MNCSTATFVDWKCQGDVRDFELAGRVLLISEHDAIRRSRCYIESHDNLSMRGQSVEVRVQELLPAQGLIASGGFFWCDELVLQ